MNLRGAKILLTGASGGIGSALATCLKHQGAELLLHANRNTDSLEGETIQGDLSIPEDVLRVAERAAFFNVNILINNCGINQFSCFETADIDRLIRTNVTGPMTLTQQLLPYLKAQSDAAILNIGSTFGEIGFPGYVTYCATKHAIKGFSEALKRELQDSSVQVFHVSPRTTNTGMNSSTANELNKILGNNSDEPDVLASKIVGALESNKHRLTIGATEKVQVKINALFPSLVDAALAKQLPTIRQHYSSTTKENCQ